MNAAERKVEREKAFSAGYAAGIARALSFLEITMSDAEEALHEPTAGAFERSEKRPGPGAAKNKPCFRCHAFAGEPCGGPSHVRASVGKKVRK
jgi:hypothetical protein